MLRSGQCEYNLSFVMSFCHSLTMQVWYEVLHTHPVARQISQQNSALFIINRQLLLARHHTTAYHYVHIWKQQDCAETCHVPTPTLPLLSPTPNSRGTDPLAIATVEFELVRNPQGFCSACQNLDMAVYKINTHTRVPNRFGKEVDGNVVRGVEGNVVRGFEGNVVRGFEGNVVRGFEGNVVRGLRGMW